MSLKYLLSTQIRHKTKKIFLKLDLRWRLSQLNQNSKDVWSLRMEADTLTWIWFYNHQRLFQAKYLQVNKIQGIFLQST